MEVGRPAHLPAHGVARQIGKLLDKTLRRAVGATTVAMGLSLLTAVPASAAATCPTVNGVAYHTCITSVSLSRATASVSGAASVPLSVAIGIHSDTGVPSGRVSQSNGPGEARDLVPELFFTIRANGQSALDRVGLTLSSGDAHDGVWHGTINITGLDAGTMTTSIVSFGGLGQPAMSYQTIPVPLRRSVVVSATRIPKFASGTLFFQPDTVHANAPFAVMGRVVDAQTGVGMPRVTVHVRVPNTACDCYLADYAATTDAAGDWVVHVPHLRAPDYKASIGGAVNSDGRRADISLATGDPYIIGSVTAALSTAAAHVGDPVLVTGTAAPAFEQSIALEKWVSHAWRLVATSPLRTSGRFTLPARPTAPGHWEYRVQDYQAHAVSAVLFLDVS